MNIKPILEALLFATPEPLTLNQLKKLLMLEVETNNVDPVGAGSPRPDQGEETSPPEEQTQPDASDQLGEIQKQMDQEISKIEIKNVLEEMIQAYQDSDRGVELVKLGDSYQFRTKIALAPYLRGLLKLPKPRLSASSMETLALVAYQQPITRNKIEQVRGVDSGGVLKTLLDRDLIRIVGKSEEPGKPIIYGTSQTFLETFNLTSLKELPDLKELEALVEKSLQTGGDALNNEESETQNDVATLEQTEADLNSVSEESADLLMELETSMDNLRNVEQSIFQKNEEKST